MSRRASVCAVELCGKWGCFLLRGFSQAFSCFLPVSIINIPVHILLWLSMSKQTDPHGSAEPFSPAVLMINTGHWIVALTVAHATLLRRQAGVSWVVSPGFNLILPAIQGRFSSDHISLSESSSFFLLFPLSFSNPTVSSLIFWHFSCPLCVCVFPPKAVFETREIHTVPHY